MIHKFLGQIPQKYITMTLRTSYNQLKNLSITFLTLRKFEFPKNKKINGGRK